jgi:hypothetical protein
MSPRVSNTTRKLFFINKKSGAGIRPETLSNL